jgi:hypothetical protein
MPQVAVIITCCLYMVSSTRAARAVKRTQPHEVQP